MTGKMMAAMAAALTLALPTAASALDRNYDVIVDGTTGAMTRSISVSVADLNLGSDHGLRQADSRITRAAKKVCGWHNGTILPATSDYRACFGDALSDAREDLGTLAQAQRQG
ncbi:UrcA family protein [Sphingobium sp. AN641]|uniref:UrcA family protein n=1 Tax=Sphingobium sp. AN641 TaxID=3133443 RepID=UPI0030BB08BA